MRTTLREPRSHTLSVWSQQHASPLIRLSRIFSDGQLIRLGRAAGVNPAASHSASHLAVFCGERIFHAMQQEFFESREVRPFFHLRAMQEPGLQKTLDRSMNLGGTHVEICSDL